MGAGVSGLSAARSRGRHRDARAGAVHTQVRHTAAWFGHICHYSRRNLLIHKTNVHI